MTVNATYQPARYVGDGVTTEFAIPFAFVDAGHIQVTVAHPPPTGGSDYEPYYPGVWGVTGASSVLFDAPIASNDIVLIERVVPLTQGTDLADGGAFPADTTEAALDLLAMQIQQVDQTGRRVIQAPALDDPELDLTLPAAGGRANRIAAWDADGKPITTAIATPGFLDQLAVSFPDPEAPTPDLVALEGLTGTGVAKRTGDDTWALLDSGAFGEALLAAVDEAEGRSLLQLGTMAQQNADFVDISGGFIQGVSLQNLAAPVPVASGGTNATTAAAARTSLGVPPTSRLVSTNNGLTGGGDLSADRTLGLTGQALALHNLVTAANKLIYATGSGAFATSDLTAFARSLLDDPDAATMRATLAAAAAARAINTGNGLTGGGDLSADRTLGLTGQALALHNLVTAADKLIYATGSGAFSTSDLTAFARSLLDDPDAATMRATLAAAAAARTITAGNGLTGGGDLSADRTLALANQIAISAPGGNGTFAIAAEGNTSLQLSRYSAVATTAATAMAQQRARGTIASPADVVVDDVLARWTAAGYGGGAFRSAGEMRIRAKAATPSGTDMQAVWQLLLSKAGFTDGATLALSCDTTAGLLIGVPLSFTRQDEALTADDQAINVTGSYLQLSSNAAAASRTFTLSTPTADTLLVIQGPPTNGAELAPSANCKLNGGATWTAGLHTMIGLWGSVQRGAWEELARTANS